MGNNENQRFSNFWFSKEIKIKNKEKGSKAERELYQMFIDNNYRAVRVAGSGTMEDSDCDLIAGKKGKKFAGGGEGGLFGCLLQVG